MAFLSLFKSSNPDNVSNKARTGKRLELNSEPLAWQHRLTLSALGCAAVWLAIAAAGTAGTAQSWLSDEAQIAAGHCSRPIIVRLSGLRCTARPHSMMAWDARPVSEAGVESLEGERRGSAASVQPAPSSGDAKRQRRSVIEIHDVLA